MPLPITLYIGYGMGDGGLIINNEEGVVIKDSDLLIYSTINKSYL